MGLMIPKILHYILRVLEGGIPPAVFLAVLWALLEPKCPRKTARRILLGFLGVALAVQVAVLAGGGRPELALTLLPLTFCLPAILGAHLLSRRPPVPTAVSWLLGLLCQHLLLVTQKLLVFPTNWLGGKAWSWIALVLLALAAAGLMAVVLRVFCPSFRSAAGELNERWWPLGALLVVLLALHSYFISGPTAPVVLIMLLLNALAAETQARKFTVQMEALRRDYELLQRKLELGWSYRHDERHHMLALSTLLQEGEADAALDYVSDWQGQLTRIESRSWCKNAAVNAVLSAYVPQAEEAGCTVETLVSLPEALPVEELPVRGPGQRHGKRHPRLSGPERGRAPARQAGADSDRQLPPHPPCGELQPRPCVHLGRWRPVRHLRHSDRPDGAAGRRFPFLFAPPGLYHQF